MSKLGNLAAGSVLGRYELILRVASGGMGEVWAARIKGTRGFQKVVALKTLLPELSHNPNFEQMFLDEAALAARIKHPNVVQVIDLGEEDQILFQVMEWVSGESLWAVMRAAAKRGGISLDVASRIICQVCAGLHAAHELRNESGQFIGLVHRDISPQNILLTAQGIAKVVDFGVAKFAGRGVAATQVGELRGKVPYMAPEHIRGQELDRRADVFALGLLYYQLVSGEHPFLGDNDQLTMTRISSTTPAPLLHERVPTVPKELSRIVASALEKSPASRTRTALEFMHEIERVVSGASLQSSNDLVAAFLKEVVGSEIDEHDIALRDALRRLDGRSSISSPQRNEPSQAERDFGPSFDDQETLELRRVTDIPVLPDPIPRTPALATPPAVTGPPSTDSASELPSFVPASASASASSGRLRRLAAIGVIAAVLGGVIIGLSLRGGPSARAPAGPPSSAGLDAMAPLPLPAPDPETRPSAAVSAPSASGSTTGSASASAPPSRSAPSKTPPPKGTSRPRGEYTPGGL